MVYTYCFQQENNSCASTHQATTLHLCITASFGHKLSTHKQCNKCIHVRQCRAHRNPKVTLSSKAIREWAGWGFIMTYKGERGNVFIGNDYYDGRHYPLVIKRMWSLLATTKEQVLKDGHRDRLRECRLRFCHRVHSKTPTTSVTY